MSKLEDRGEVFKGPIVGPNGIDFYKESEFKLPENCVAFCHRCNIGFKTMEESQLHNQKYHDYRKVQVL